MSDQQSQSRGNRPGAAQRDPSSPQYPGGEGGALPGIAELTKLIQALSQAGGVPITLSTIPPPSIDTGERLSQAPRRTVLFPPCAEELLGLVRTQIRDEITDHFTEYFAFERHRIFGQHRTSTGTLEDLDAQLGTNLDGGLLRCLASGPIVTSQPPTTVASGAGRAEIWPTECCACPPCVTLRGNRNRLAAVPPAPAGIVPSITRLFIGDLVWLFYMEQLGIFQILGVILDAFASNGRLPISSGALDPADIRDDITALVLEVMVRQTKMGLSSTVRDRTSAYRTCLGWISQSGRKVNVDTQVNTGFNTLFHKFVYHALEFYKDKRLAVAIRGTAAPVAPPSVATLITVSDTLDVLKKRFEVFDYGRNYYNTLSGIVWAIAGMAMIRELRQTLGIPPAYSDPHEYIPAAYDLLVMKRPVTHGDTNRYILHRECARNGRDILLDLEVVDHLAKSPGQDLENWLTQVESKVEGYRTAYRALTGVDIGATATPAIEQQV